MSTVPNEFRIKWPPKETWTDATREVQSFWGEPNSWEEGSKTNVINVMANMIHSTGISEQTMITKKVLDAAHKLQAIGCFCIGVNQVNLKTATKRGVVVFNAPYSNTRSVAELVIGASIMLIRKIIDKNNAAHKGIWMKDATGSYELRGKTLGIIGYGNIGSQLSVLAESLGMKVIFYKENLEEAAILTELDGLFDSFKKERNHGCVNNCSINSFFIGAKTFTGFYERLAQCI